MSLHEIRIVLDQPIAQPHVLESQILGPHHLCVRILTGHSIDSFEGIRRWRTHIEPCMVLRTDSGVEVGKT